MNKKVSRVKMAILTDCHLRVNFYGKKIQMINGKVQVFCLCSSRWRKLSSMLMSASYR